LVAMSEKLGRGTVFRLGGDEFLFVIPDERLSEAEIADINRDLLALMSKPVRVDNREIQVGASIGFYSCAEKQAPINDLLRRLDMAMYQSKRTGRNRATEAVDPADYAPAF
ncbi:MAG: GGDEF domain-containing protein, partial [Betaproteobacteria bacterium]